MEERESEKAENKKVEPQAEALADLPLTDEQAEDSRAGSERPIPYLKIQLKDVFIA